MVNLMEYLPSFYSDDLYVNNIQNTYNNMLNQFEADIRLRKSILC